MNSYGEYVAFINQSREAELFAKYYSDAAGVRIPLSRVAELQPALPEDLSLWVDAGIDALAQGPSINSEYEAHLKQFKHGAALLAKGVVGNCPEMLVRSFTEDVLDRCEHTTAKWISLPQIPYDTEKTAAKQKLNRSLVTAAESWRTSHARSSKLMLPLILTKSCAADTKGRWRREIVKHVDWVQRNCGIDGVWVVNADLEDERGSAPNQDKRFPGLIALHEEIRSSLQDDIRVVAGPYWAMNLILWARGLAEHPAIGIAGSYKYYVPGGHPFRAADRIVIPPLLRRAKVSDELGVWLQSSAQLLSQKASPAGSLGGVGSSLSQAASELGSLARQYRRLQGANAREQVAVFYKEWIARIERIQPQIRALALRQEFSEANVVGSLLSNLPRGDYAIQPGRLAQQFMLCCL